MFGYGSQNQVSQNDYDMNLMREITLTLRWDQSSGLQTINIEYMRSNFENFFQKIRKRRKAGFRSRKSEQRLLNTSPDSTFMANVGSYGRHSLCRLIMQHQEYFLGSGGNILTIKTRVKILKK